MKATMMPKKGPSNRLNVPLRQLGQCQGWLPASTRPVAASGAGTALDGPSRGTIPACIGPLCSQLTSLQSSVEIQDSVRELGTNSAAAGFKGLAPDMASRECDAEKVRGKTGSARVGSLG